MSFLELIVEILSWIFILGGSAFMLIGAIGTMRFPDFWARIHAVSVTDSAGMLLLIVGMMLQAGFTLVTAKLLLIGIFLFITGPTATHAVANAAMVSGFLPEGMKRPAKPKSAKSKKAASKKSTRKRVPARSSARSKNSARANKGSAE